jgi:hypothetical protein
MGNFLQHLIKRPSLEAKKISKRSNLIYNGASNGKPWRGWEYKEVQANFLWSFKGKPLSGWEDMAMKNRKWSHKINLPKI